MTQERVGTLDRVVNFRLVLAHYVAYASVNVALLVLNVVTTTDTWWFLWVVWVWGIVVAGHVGYFSRGWVGAQVLAFIVGGIGLIVVDLVYSDQRWFYWPLLGWSLILILHVLLSISLRQRYLSLEKSLLTDEVDRDAGS